MIHYESHYITSAIVDFAAANAAVQAFLAKYCSNCALQKFGFTDSGQTVAQRCTRGGFALSCGTAAPLITDHPATTAEVMAYNYANCNPAAVGRWQDFTPAQKKAVYTQRPPARRLTVIPSPVVQGSAGTAAPAGTPSIPGCPPGFYWAIGLTGCSCQPNGSGTPRASLEDLRRCGIVK